MHGRLFKRVFKRELLQTMSKVIDRIPDLVFCGRMSEEQGYELRHATS